LQNGKKGSVVPAGVKKGAKRRERHLEEQRREHGEKGLGTRKVFPGKRSERRKEKSAHCKPSIKYHLEERREGGTVLREKEITKKGKL